MKHLDQGGAGRCGQYCVAMLAGVGIVEALLAVGRDGATSCQDRRRGLERLGKECGPTVRVYRVEQLPRRGRLLVRLQKPGARFGHCVIFTRTRVYDPAYPQVVARRTYEAWLQRMKAWPTSYFTVET